MGIAPDYVLDRMQPYEINALMRHHTHLGRDDWERARFLAYVTAQCQSTKKMTVADIIKFPWDKEEEPESDTAMSEADRIKLTELAKKFESVI